MKKLVALIMCVAMLLCMGTAMAEDYAIATDTAFRPFEYTDENGELVGIDMEILAAIEKGDAAAASEATRQHILQALRDINRNSEGDRPQ